MRGGNDGLYLGLEGVENEWKSKLPKPHHYTSFDEWNNRQAGTMKPLEASRVQHHDRYNVTLYKGTTLFSNCYQQEEKSTNPAHWMMKLGLMFELTTCYSRNFASKVFTEQIRMPFNQMYMHQCPDPFVSDWKWGKTIFSIVSTNMLNHEIIDKNTKYFSTGFVPKEERKEDYYHCFEDVYLSNRNGIWLQMPANHVNFRIDSAKLSGEPAMALSTPEDVKSSLPIGSVQTYCPAATAQEKISSARIKIFQRTNTKFLRSFINLPEVLVLAQKYTSVPIEVVTVNDTSTVADQIRLFNSFDVLITSHGSHLANGM